MANAGNQIKRKTITRNMPSRTGAATSSSSSNNYRNQYNNYRTRFKSVGINPEDVTDNRNWLEKALNLEKDQNILFDVFELIGRPQKALFGGIESLQEGGSFGEGALEGLKGERRTTGKDLLVNQGMDDTEGKLDLADVLGFGLDVFADPMDIPLIPVKAASTGVKAIDTASDIMKAADKTKDVVKAVDTASDAYKFISPSQGLFKLAGKGIKGAAKITDKGVEKVLKGIDAKQLRNIEKVASETGQTTTDIINQVGGKSDLLGNYKALKKGITDSLDSSKMLGGLVGKTRQSANKVDYADAMARARKEAVKQQTQKVAEDIAKKTGKNADNVSKKLTEDIFRYMEYEQKGTIDGSKFLKNLSGKANEFKGTKESVKAIEDVINNYNKGLLKNSQITFDIAKDGKSLKIKPKNVQMFKNNPEIQDLFSKLDLKKDLGYNEKQLKELKQIGKRFGKGGDLEDIYQTNKNLLRKDIPEIYKKAGIDYSQIASRDDYVPRAVNVEFAEKPGTGYNKGLVDTKAFASRKHTAPAEVENIRKQEEIVQKQARINKQLESIEKQFSTNKIDSLEAQKQAVELKKAEKIKKYNDNLAKLGDKQSRIKESLDKVSRVKNEVATKFDEKTINNIAKVKDEALTASISKASTDFNTATKEYNNLIKKLSDTDLTEKELKALNSQVDKISNKMTNAQRKLNLKIDAVNNFTNNRTDMVLKNAKSAIAKSEKEAVKEAKLTSQLGETLEKTNLLTQAQTDSIEHFDKVINTLDAQIKGIDPELDKKLLAKQKRLQNAQLVLNNQDGKDLFKLDYYAGIDNFLDKTATQAKGIAVYRDALATEALYNPEYIKKAEDLVDGEVPRGFTRVNGDVLANQFDNIKEFLPKNSEALKALAEDFKGKTLYMDKDFARLMNVTKNSKDQANALVNIMDKFNNMFKKYKILTPGFQMRNIAGNTTNMVLSGMPANKIPQYWGKAADILNSSDELLAKAAQGIELTSKEAKKLEILQQFYEGGFKDAGTRLQDLEQLRKTVQGKKGPLNKLTELNAKMNESMDGLNRLALLMYANDNPKYIQKLGKSNAIEAVKYALMDPSNMSDFEKNVMKKIIPFYTFTKQNLMFQATNIMKNTPKYNRLIKGINSIYNNLDENEYFKYQKEGMQIPLPITDSNGNRLFLKTNLPLSDLGEWMSNPMQRTLASTAPLIRTPFEMATGKNIFTGQDSSYKNISNAIETATGKKLPSGVQNATAKAEQILAGLGVDTISTNLVKKVTSAIKTYNGDMDNQAMWAEIFRSVLQNTNQEKIENSRIYEDMETYQQYIKQLKNQGISIPTIRDLNKQSKRSLRKVKSRRNK